MSLDTGGSALIVKQGCFFSRRGGSRGRSSCVSITRDILPVPRSRPKTNFERWAQLKKRHDSVDAVGWGLLRGTPAEGGVCLWHRGLHQG